MTTIMTITTIAITALLTHCIEAAIRQYRGLEVHDKNWLVEKEQEWITDLTEQMEVTYATDLQSLLDQNDLLSTENENLNRNLVLEEQNHLVTLRKFEAFCEELRKDSISANFLIRFKSKHLLRDYYNDSLTKIISIMNQEVA